MFYVNYTLKKKCPKNQKSAHSCNNGTVISSEDIVFTVKKYPTVNN